MRGVDSTLTRSTPSNYLCSLPSHLLYPHTISGLTLSLLSACLCPHICSALTLCLPSHHRCLFRYQGDGTQVKYLRLTRATSFKFKVLATNSVGDSVISAESALILTTDLYEPTFVLRFMLQFDIVLNDTLSIDAFNQTLANDLAYVIPGCTSDRFYLEMVNASEIFRMLVTTQSVKANIGLNRTSPTAWVSHFACHMLAPAHGCCILSTDAWCCILRSDA